MNEPERNRHIQFLRSLPRPLRDKNGRAVPYPGTWMKFPGEELPRRLYKIEITTKGPALFLYYNPNIQQRLLETRYLTPEGMGEEPRFWYGQFVTDKKEPGKVYYVWDIYFRKKRFEYDLLEVEGPQRGKMKIGQGRLNAALIVDREPLRRVISLPSI